LNTHSTARASRVGFAAFAIVALLSQAGCFGPPGSTKEEELANANLMRTETLEELYKREPGIKPEVEKAVGYVAMHGGSAHLGLVSLATAYMVIVNNKTGKVTHDNFFRFGVGPGLAIKSYRGIFLINSEETMSKLEDTPWIWGAGLEASFRFGEFGGSLSDVYMFGTDTNAYYWTKNGVALEAVLLAVGKTWRDDLEEKK